jgi:hypothetical protein
MQHVHTIGTSFAALPQRAPRAVQKSSTPRPEAAAGGPVPCHFCQWGARSLQRKVTDPRTVTPTPPAGYAGVKVKF